MVTEILLVVAAIAVNLQSHGWIAGWMAAIAAVMVTRAIIEKAVR